MISMQKIVIASRNQGKIAEFKELLKDLPVEIMTLSDFPSIPEIQETGSSFRENALLKAHAVTASTGLIALADDSGLEVDCLGGAPGVYSSRYAGPEQDDAANIRKLLAALKGVPLHQRTGRFRCVIAITTPEGGEYLSEGVCEGLIALEPRGDGGFGYDPLFLVPALGKTFAELSHEVKNRISHRAQAMRNARELLRRILGKTEEREDAGGHPE